MESPPEYRWNQWEIASGYDAAASLVHPYYIQVQDAVLDALPTDPPPRLIVDAGGGSGRLLQRCLEEFPEARAVLLDQSEPFLELARNRLAPFGDRVVLHRARLQDDWRPLLDEPPDAIVSTSAVHHLDPAEKQAFYRFCFEALAPGGVLANGDEVRDPDDHRYRASLEKWADHMQELARAGRIPAAFADTLLKWRQRNLERFGEPRVSGDDCHETVEVQLEYLHAAGFQNVRATWRRDMWAVLVGEKPQTQVVESRA